MDDHAELEKAASLIDMVENAAPIETPEAILLRYIAFGRAAEIYGNISVKQLASHASEMVRYWRGL